MLRNQRDQVARRFEVGRSGTGCDGHDLDGEGRLGEVDARALR